MLIYFKKIWHLFFAKLVATNVLNGKVTSECSHHLFYCGKVCLKNKKKSLNLAIHM